jgi:Ca2+/Na+ antiporter
MANIAIIGIVGLGKPFSLRLDVAYYLLAAFLLVLLAVFSVASRTGRQFSLREGEVLLGIYILFLVSQLAFLALP